MADTPQAPQRLKDWQVVLYTVLLPVSASVFVMGLLGIIVLSGIFFFSFCGHAMVSDLSTTVCCGMPLMKPWWSWQTINRSPGLAERRLPITCDILSPSIQVRTVPPSLILHPDTLNRCQQLLPLKLRATLKIKLLLGRCP